MTKFGLSGTLRGRIEMGDWTVTSGSSWHPGTVVVVLYGNDEGEECSGQLVDTVQQVWCLSVCPSRSQACLITHIMTRSTANLLTLTSHDKDRMVDCEITPHCWLTDAWKYVASSATSTAHPFSTVEVGNTCGSVVYPYRAYWRAFYSLLIWNRKVQIPTCSAWFGPGGGGGWWYFTKLSVTRFSMR